tara:strand:- start:3789 stop:4829 length:1041 start_codon:yes stop_codon:yes gene_type:complete
MKFLISAAGTGGHVFPALEFSQECMRNNHRVIWFGTNSGIEKNLVRDHKINFKTIPMSGFRGKGFLAKVISVVGLAFSTVKMVSFLFRHKIDYVVCFGGYISLPVGIAAILTNKSLILHEQNSILGTSNKLLAKFAKIIFLGFPLSVGSTKNTKIVGNPIRKITDLKNNSHNNKDVIKIYITGGSLGSDFINKNIPVAIGSLNASIEVKHQSGIGKSEGIMALYSKDILVEVEEFYKCPQEIIFWADFVISRAGALTLSEVISMNKGSLMIPFPSSIDNHQLLNAQMVENNKMGIIHEESESNELLCKRLQNIVDKRLFSQWQEFENEIDHFQASQRMLSSILKIQ